MPRLVTRNSEPYEALGAIDIPRSHAVRIAELERDSLLLRAAQGGPCAARWHEAAYAAARVVDALRGGDDKGVVPHMYDVAKAWKRAARCSRYPVPLGQEPKKENLLVEFAPMLAIIAGVTLFWWEREGKEKYRRRKVRK